MKKIIFPLVVIALALNATAQQVSVQIAKKAAKNYLTAYEPSYSNQQLSHYTTLNDPDGNAALYVFNIGDEGFVIASADMMYSPVVGYSFNGCYDSSRVPTNLKWWLENSYTDMWAAKKSTSDAKAAADAEIKAQQNRWRQEWEQLNSGKTIDMAGPTKSVEALVETKWDQGAGYNNYCPLYAEGNNGRSVTGCVATAMAQIIRYHRYPNTGFHHKGYTHSTYGYLYADFDSAYYNFDYMPISVSAYSSTAQQHAVSLLCYHCGISVKMNYENPNHTSGSGAFSKDVPAGLRYFGYCDAVYMMKSAYNSVWDSLLRHDLDEGRPVYYSGSSTSGGHAFVCDGYRNNGRYHFNFGWSGYGDGFYTLTSVNGYSSDQAAVFNIIPSHLGPMRDTLYVAPDGTGSGSSWDDAYGDLNKAMNLMNLCMGGTIWAKAGTYHGESNSDASFKLQSRITLYGGFAGTESSLNQRDLEHNKTILSGDGQRRVLAETYNVSSSNIYDITLANGYAPTNSATSIGSGVRMERCTIENCTTTNEESAALYVSDNTLYNCIIHNNNGGGVSVEDGHIKNSLIAHNSGYGLRVDRGTVDGCDMVCNAGVGLKNINAEKVRNCVIWRNDSSLYLNDISNIFFSAIEGLGEKDSNSNFGLNHDNRPDDNSGPMFMNPNLTVGPASELGDWHISNLSPLTNAGDTLRKGSYAMDLDNNSRFRAGRVDIGCYEQDPNVSIDVVDNNMNYSIYPNPANSMIHIDGIYGLVEIYDVMGQRVMTFTSNGSTQIDITPLSVGVYIVRAQGNTMKFMKR